MFALLAALGLTLAPVSSQQTSVQPMSKQAMVYEGRADGQGDATLRLEIISNKGRHLVTGGHFEHKGIRYPIISFTFNLEGDSPGEALAGFQLKHTDESRARAKVADFVAAGIGELTVHDDTGRATGWLELRGYGKFVFNVPAAKDAADPKKKSAQESRLIFAGPVGSETRPDGMLRLVADRRDGKYVVAGGLLSAGTNQYHITASEGQRQGFKLVQTVLVEAGPTHWHPVLLEVGDGIVNFDERNGKAYGLITFEGTTHLFSIPLVVPNGRTK